MRTSSDDVGGILSDLQMFLDGGTFDPAAWEDWIDTVEVLKEEQSKWNEIKK